jgi:acyl carrier protein
MPDSISNEVMDVLAKHAQLEREKITPSTSLNMIGVDSILMVEIIYDLEEKFDISIPDPDFVSGQNQQFNTVADVVRIVEELIRQQRPAE